MMPSTTRILFLSSLLTATCAAQTVFVVDGLNRPGADFTDLPAAEAAAQHGDTIVLRSDGGFYHPVATQKALTITGDSPGIAEFVGTGQGFSIHDLPAGRDFVLQNVEVFASSGAPPRLVVQNCQGRVHLVRVRMPASYTTPGVEVSLCRAVTVRDCEFQGSPGLLAQNSTIAVSETRSFGVAAGPTMQASSGVVLIDTTAWFADVQTSGGAAWHTTAPAPAVQLVNANLSFTGVGVFSSALAGPLGSQTTQGYNPAVPAIQGQNSLLRIDPGVRLESTGSATTVVGVTTTTTAIPCYTMVGVPLLQGSYDAGDAIAQATVAGLPADPLPIPGAEGRLWLEPDGMLVLSGALGGYGGFYEFLLPPGLTFTVQVVSLQAGTLELSTPAIIHSRP